MTNLTRKTQKIFAGDFLGNPSQTEIAVFGSKAGGSVSYSDDLDNIQSAAWLGGFEDAVVLEGTKKVPMKQDMNAVLYGLSYNLAYVLQKGIPEYSATTTYYTSNIVREAGTYTLYASAIDSNTGQALSDPTKWTKLGALTQASETLAGFVEKATNAETAAGTDDARYISPANLASLFNTSDRSTNGYARLPVKVGGAFVEIIIQWGFVAGATTSATFPLAFPNAFLAAVAIDRLGAAATTYAYQIINPSTTGMTISRTGTLILDKNWIAIGY